jgi:guanine nucleotide-binding protein subunit alpha
VRCRARTIGITETVFQLRDHEMLMVDVGGQKSERRKWIHCFQDVTSILFLVSLSGYDQCLVEDKDAVRAITDGLDGTYGHPIESNARCHDNLGFNMSLPMVQINVDCGSLQSLTNYPALNVSLQILFLNKDDLFQSKIQHSDIKTFFPV